MKRYMFLICFTVVAWTIIGTGCTASFINAKAIYKQGCASRAINCAIIAGTEDTRIAQDAGNLKYGKTMGHAKAQKLIDDRWPWLRKSGDGVIATNKKPMGFKPLYHFDTKQFIGLEYFIRF